MRYIPGRFRYPALVLGLAGLYFATAQFGLLLQLPGTNASPVWPPSGIGLAAGMLFGLRAWPGIAVGAFLANLLTLPATTAGVCAATGIAIGNTLEQVAALVIMRWWLPSLHPFDRPHDILRFLGTIAGACALASTVGATSLWLAGIIGGHLYGPVWFTWWLGDSAGILVLTPAVVCWWRRPRPGLSGSRRAELAALVVATGLTAELTFGGWFSVAVPFLVVAGPLWAAFRFGPRETALLPVVLSVITLTHAWHWADLLTVSGLRGVYVPFVSGASNVNDSLLMLQLFVCAVGMTAVTLAAAVAQRDRTESQLRASERRYRALVQATPQVIWTTASVSSWWRDLTGQTEAESAGSGWLDAVHPEDRDRVRGAWAHAFESRTPYDVEYRLRTRAGAYRHYAVRGVALLDAHGRLEEWVGTLTDVDDRKQHEHQLRAWNETLEHRVAERTAALEVSEQRFRAIFHSQFQFIGLMSPDGTLVEANRTALAAAGVPETAVLGRPFWETAWWAHDRYQQERLKEAVRRAAAGRPDRFEASHPTAAGGLIWVDFSITPFYDEQGRVSLLIPEGRDITDRKRVEAALEEQEERFRNAFEFAPIGMALVGTDGRWLRVNQSICEILGFSEAELLATDFQTITHPDDLNADLGYVQQVLDGTINSYQMEKRYLHNRGHVVDVLLSVSLVRTPTREPLYFISQIQDVTKRTAAERALRSSEERFRLLVEGATDYGIFQLDRAGTIVNWNSGAQRINGYGAEEIIGRHFSVFYPHETVAAGHPEHELAVALARGRYHEEGERVRKDGSRLWASVTITALRDHAGEHVGFVKITQDITDRKTAEEQIRASLREKEVMLREIHHRVKNNLAVISSLFGLQARSLNDGASVRALREAQDRVLSMALVHQHLYNSADLGAVAFGEYARTLAGQVFQVNHLPTSEIKLELDVEAVRLSIDQAIPCGLILNELLSNCLKHAFRDRPGGRILLTLSVQDTVCRLRVADDGAGMPAELDVRSAKSLGVRLVRTLARQLDGTIEYRPTGPGTEALFTFPLVTGPKGKPSLPTPHPNVRTPSGGKTPSTE